MKMKPTTRQPQSEDLTLAYMVGVEAGRKAALAPFARLLEQYREADTGPLRLVYLEAALKEARGGMNNAKVLTSDEGGL
jgi:hypothetical protein